MPLSNEQFGRLKELSSKGSLTSAELSELRGLSASSAPQPEELPAPSQQPILSQGTVAEIKQGAAMTLGKIGEAATKIPTGVMQAVSGQGTQTLGEGMSALGYATGVTNPDFLRVAPAVVTSFITKNLAPVQQAISASAAAYIGSRTAGDDNPQALKNATLNLVTMGPVSSSGKFLKPAFIESMKDIARFGTAGAAAQVVERVAEAKEDVPYRTFGQFAQDVGKGAPLAVAGLFTGPLRSAVAKTNFNQRMIEEVRADVSKSLDANKLTLGMLLPDQWAQVEGKLAADNPALAAKIAALGDSALERFRKIVPKELQTDAEIATNLNQFTSAIAKENATLAKLEDAALSAARSAKVAAGLGIAPSEIAKLESAATASAMAAVNQRARASYWKDLADRTTGTLKPISETMNEFQRNVDSIFELRSKQADIHYKNTGIPLAEKFIAKEDLTAALKSGLSQRSSAYRDKVIAAIENIDGKDTPAISINQMREVRANIADAFAGADPKQLSAIESIADEAYGILTKKTNQLAASVYGEEPAKALASVNDWWGRAANAKNSRYARPLVAGEMQETVPERLAAQVARGEFQGVDDYFRFIDTVAELAPDVANSGRSAVYNSIRDGFIANAARGSDRVDFDALTRNLGALAARPKKGFDVEALGFGNTQQLKTINQALRDFSPSGVVDSSVLDEFYRNPLVQKELKVGGTAGLAEAAKKTAAKKAFENLVESQVIADRLGIQLGRKSDAAFAEAALARQAGMDLDAQKAVLDNMKKTPLYEVLSRRAAGIPTDFGPQAGSISKAIRNMRPVDRADFVAALNKDYPGLSKQVQERFAADVISDLIVPDNMARDGRLYELDPERVRRFFQPRLDQRSSGAYQLKQVLSPEAYSHMEKSLPAVARLAQYARSGGMATANRELFDALGVGFAASQNRAGATAGYSSLFARLGNLVNEGRYSLISKIVTDPKFSKAYFGANGAIDATLNSLRVPQAMLFKANPELLAEAAAVEAGQ